MTDRGGGTYCRMCRRDSARIDLREKTATCSRCGQVRMLSAREVAEFRPQPKQEALF